MNSKHFFSLCTDYVIFVSYMLYSTSLTKEIRSDTCMELRAISRMLASQGLWMCVPRYFDNLDANDGS